MTGYMQRNGLNGGELELLVFESLIDSVFDH